MNRQYDALVLPRNHDGNGATTKAIALAKLMDKIGINPRDTPVIHIDDAEHHIRQFRESTLFGDLHLVAPIYDKPIPVADTAVQEPLMAFTAVHHRLESLKIFD